MLLDSLVAACMLLCSKAEDVFAKINNMLLDSSLDKKTKMAATRIF
jgi:hypothetical protein